MPSFSLGCLQILNTFISNVMFPKDSFKTPFLQLIIALDAARNGRPNMIGIWVHELGTGYVSNTIKSTGK